ncbi:MAG: ABC transporter substrate-binding protein [Actinobacteria bacterium]|nr:ABC transporter substrate-binding protein [Actinomycetota bacterium]
MITHSLKKGKGRLLAVAVVASTALVAVAGSAQASTTPVAKAKKIRIGYFANVTHATALVGVQEKFFEKTFAKDKTKVEFVVFNAGPAVIEAMKGGAIDASYIGPNPALAGYASTNGNLLRIVAGATLNGAQLIVNSSINSVAELKGKTIATPQLGNTQDVAARTYFKSQGFATNISGGGDVKIAPTENATSLTLFKSGKLDGAWVPEPWASRLVLEGNGKMLLDEKNLWPNQKFLTQAKNVVKVKADIQAELLAKTGKNLTTETLDRAWSNVTISNEPLAKGLVSTANNAIAAGLLQVPAQGLTKIYDLRILNKILLAKNPSFKKYSASGLGLS